MTITEFLLARFDDDERDMEGYFAEDIAAGNTGVGTWVHWMRADREAKRALLAWATEGEQEGNGWGAACGWVPGFLALPYVDHPDYQQEWAL